MISISVVIPLYNKAKYIERALQSVVNQTMQPSEIIIVDDGSTDDSVGRVQAFIKSNPTVAIQLNQQVNQGPSVARNHGVDLAQSQWVALLDADDFWLEGHLAQFATGIQSAPQCSVFANGYRFGYASGDIPACFNTHSAGELTDYFAACAHAALPMTSSSVLIKRELYLALGGMNPGWRTGEDQDLWSRLAVHTKIYFCPTVSAVYWVGERAGQNSNEGYLHRIVEPPPHLDTYFSLLQRNDITDDLKRSIAYLAYLTVLNCVKHNAMAGNKEKIWRLLQQHWALKPYRYHCYTLAAYLCCILPTRLIKRIFSRASTSKTD